MPIPTKVIAVVALCLCLGGCAATAETDLPEEELSGLSVEQAAEIADGEVTFDEYQAAFQRFRACLADEGYEILVQGENNQIVDYGIPSAAVESGVDRECYDLEFRHVDTAWQLTNEDTSRSAQVIRDCLTSNGLAPDETLQEMVEQLRQAGIESTSCIEKR